MSSSKNDIAWEKLFEKHCILNRLANNERVAISSAEINAFREARLMTKFDHRSQLPELFAKHKLSILPCDFNKEDVEITTVGFPTFLESIDCKNVTKR